VEYNSYASLKHLIMSYRAGYSANERREIESNLFHGYLKGVISTTALELGIDIGSLDAVIHLGFPYSVAGYFQVCSIILLNIFEGINKCYGIIAYFY